MRDYMNIASAPASEDCAQVGTDDYSMRAQRECQALINQLRRELGDEPDYTNLKIKSFPHDFGTYYEVVCYYDDEDEDSRDYAFRCEGELPDKWDNKAREELAGYERI